MDLLPQTNINLNVVENGEEELTRTEEKSLMGSSFISGGTYGKNGIQEHFNKRSYNPPLKWPTKLGKMFSCRA